jgi:hypothetical protein
MPKTAGKKTPRPAPDKRRAALMGPNLVEDVVIGGLRFGHAIDSHLNVFFEGHGLTPLQFNALRILYVRDPENVGLPTGAIAARLLSRVPDVW